MNNLMRIDAALVDFAYIKSQAKSVFDNLDISENTKTDYKYRIGLFLKFLKKNPLTPNTYLDFKRYLASRTDYSVATKNKYLATAKVFLRELNKHGVLPVDITQNIKLFTQEKKHKKEGLSQEEIMRLVDKLNQSPHNPILKTLG